MVTFTADIDKDAYEMILKYAKDNNLTFSEAVSHMVRKTYEMYPEMFVGFQPKSSNKVEE